MTKTPKPLYRAGDRVAVWLDVAMTGSAGPGAVIGDQLVPLSKLEVAEHQRAIREGDNVTAPSFTPGEFGRVTFLLDSGGVVHHRDNPRQSTFACVIVDGAPPRIMSTDQLTRKDS